MEYNQYKCLQQYINGVAQDVYKKGDLVKTADFDTIEDCENNISPHPPTPSKECFTWVNTTDNVIKVQKVKGSSTAWLTESVSPVCIDKPTYLRFGYDEEQNPYAKNITSLDITRIDTSSINDMTRMFYYCQSLGSIDLSKFDTSNCTDFSYMFEGCHSLGSLDLSNFNTAKVQSMHGMIEACNSLGSLDLSNFNTGNCTDFSWMFYHCVSLGSLYLSSFDTSNSTNFRAMFGYCESLGSLDLSSFNTSKCTNFSAMFLACSSLGSLDLSNFDISKATSFNDMFYGCDKLTHIKCKQVFKNWCITNQTTISLPSTLRNGAGTWEIVG